MPTLPSWRARRPAIIGYTKRGLPIREIMGGGTSFGELTTATEVELEQAQKRYARANETIKTILAKAKHEGRANVTQDEDAEIEACHKARSQAKLDITGVQHKLDELRRAESEEREYEALMTQRRADPATATASKPAYDQVARIGAEERTYHRGNSGQGGLFLKDVMRQYMFRDMNSEVRLQRHMQEERVERGQYMERAGGTTGDFTGLTVPQYLTEMYAPLIRALRPFADICNQHDLPAQGMTINISRITTGTAVGLQTTQSTSTGIGATNPADTLLTENVQTAAGIAVLSRQAIERGTGIEDVTMSDLQRAYATNLDSTLLNQATTGLSAVAGTSATFTSGSPTVALFYPNILAAASASEANLLAQAQPNYAVMHPRRWYWMANALGATWPLINQQGFPSYNIGQANPVGYNQGVRGILPMGLQVIGDANVATNLGAGTNQDEVYIVATDECHLWEDPNAPQFIRAEQPAAGTLGVQLILYGYFAYTFRRYTNGQQKIAGTGLTTPTFTGS